MKLLRSFPSELVSCLENFKKAELFVSHSNASLLFDLSKVGLKYFEKNVINGIEEAYKFLKLVEGLFDDPLYQNDLLQQGLKGFYSHLVSEFTSNLIALSEAVEKDLVTLEDINKNNNNQYQLTNEWLSAFEAFQGVIKKLDDDKNTPLFSSSQQQNNNNNNQLTIYDEGKVKGLIISFLENLTNKELSIDLLIKICVLSGDAERLKLALEEIKKYPKSLKRFRDHDLYPNVTQLIEIAANAKQQEIVSQLIEFVMANPIENVTKREKPSLLNLFLSSTVESKEQRFYDFSQLIFTLIEKNYLQEALKILTSMHPFVGEKQKSLAMIEFVIVALAQQDFDFLHALKEKCEKDNSQWLLFKQAFRKAIKVTEPAILKNIFEKSWVTELFNNELLETEIIAIITAPSLPVERKAELIDLFLDKIPQTENVITDENLPGKVEDLMQRSEISSAKSLCQFTNVYPNMKALESKASSYVNGKLKVGKEQDVLEELTFLHKMEAFHPTIEHLKLAFERSNMKMICFILSHSNITPEALLKLPAFNTFKQQSFNEKLSNQVQLFNQFVPILKQSHSWTDFVKKSLLNPVMSEKASVLSSFSFLNRNSKTKTDAFASLIEDFLQEVTSNSNNNNANDMIDSPDTILNVLKTLKGNTEHSQFVLQSLIQFFEMVQQHQLESDPNNNASIDILNMQNNEPALRTSPQPK